MSLSNYLRYVDYRADQISAKWTDLLKEYGRVLVVGRITDRLFGLGKGDILLVYKYCSSEYKNYICAAEIIEQSEMQCGEKAISEVGMYYKDIPIAVLSTGKNEKESYIELLLKNLNIESTIEARNKARKEVSDEEIAEYERRRKAFFEYFENY